MLAVASLCYAKLPYGSHLTIIIIGDVINTDLETLWLYADNSYTNNSNMTKGALPESLRPWEGNRVYLGSMKLSWVT